MLSEQGDGVGVGVRDHALDLGVDDGAGRLRKGRVAGDDLAEPGREAVLLDRPARELGRLLEVVGGAGGDPAEDRLLGGAAAEGGDERLMQVVGIV